MPIFVTVPILTPGQSAKLGVSSTDAGVTTVQLTFSGAAEGTATATYPPVMNQRSGLSGTSVEYVTFDVLNNTFGSVAIDGQAYSGTQAVGPAYRRICPVNSSADKITEAAPESEETVASLGLFGAPAETTDETPVYETPVVEPEQVAVNPYEEPTANPYAVPASTYEEPAVNPYAVPVNPYEVAANPYAAPAAETYTAPVEPAYSAPVAYNAPETASDAENDDSGS